MSMLAYRRRKSIIPDEAEKIEAECQASATVVPDTTSSSELLPISKRHPGLFYFLFLLFFLLDIE